MNKKKKITLICVLMTLLGCSIGLAVFTDKLLYHPINQDGDPTSLYIDLDDTNDSIRIKSQLEWRFDWLNKAMKYNLRTGHYIVTPGMKSIEMYRMLRNGKQVPIKLTIPSVRTMDKLASYVGSRLMIDSAEISSHLYDSLYLQSLGYSKQSIPSFFIPNTYEVYWDVSFEKLMKRLVKEHDSFWNEERTRLADSLGYSKLEIATLASIVDEETANNGEKPMIAGMYLNRLKIGMLLQADPTVKFAMAAFSLRRIYNDHLKTDNPYNTYMYKGLPPGPIRIPSIAGLDAVLHAADHKFLYMCAKEDFSGTHNFAVTYNEHLKNARKYIKALNERNIK